MFIVLGVYLVTTKWSFWGYLIVLFLLFYVTGYDAIEIDFNRRKYRLIMSFFFLKFGKWVDLPFIERLNVYPTVEFRGGEREEYPLFTKRNVYEIKTMPSKGRVDFIIGRFSSISEAMIKVEELSRNLNVEYDVKLREGDSL